MQPYSMDLRQRVLADCDAGLTTRAVAGKYRVSAAWVRRLKQRRRDTGAVGGRRALRPLAHDGARGGAAGRSPMHGR